MNQHLRLYTFVNFYLSSIQQGIQSGHIVHSMFVKYPSEEINNHSGALLWDWARNHRTMIVLNGGAGPDIISGFEAIQTLRIKAESGLTLPHECFYEDASLDGMMTGFGIVVPECYYDAKKVVASTAVAELNSYVFENQDGRRVYAADTPEWHFINLLKSCPLAR